MSRPKATSPTEPQQDEVPELATFGQRFAALIVDWILCVLLGNGLVAVNVLPELEYPVWPSVLMALYYAVFVGFFTQTVGMRLAKIHCVNAAEGTPLGLPRALLRGVLVVLVIPILTAFSDPHRRGLHDKLSGSAVIRPKAS
ncbi:RDD family protein [Stackebrandtia nassauensis]|uniref:RDD domain containing protein n=1 Tax=Stackebrandtia nassauensis (strain DSM 44728 / CIP 108903 / NRRL B-16338 / NBRC 102104 / LLR-40K-21) TaxID=446470 RepID=D3Q8U4_STANL|nr:RDD family protein [Stackebrandtia nassauensis]ADD44536.1 RDD domain containing protein [Stackebrandtia nassauensis DSM 44728]